MERWMGIDSPVDYWNVCDVAGWVVIVIIIHMHASLVHSNFITTELYHDVPSMPSEVDRMDGWGLYFIIRCIIWVQRMSSCSCCGVDGEE